MAIKVLDAAAVSIDGHQRISAGGARNTDKARPQAPHGAQRAKVLLEFDGNHLDCRLSVGYRCESQKGTDLVQSKLTNSAVISVRCFCL